MEVEQLLMEIVELKGQYKDMDVTHTVHIAKMNAKIDKLEEDVAWNKYKRCLAMAQEWRNYAAFCGMQSSCHNHRGFGKTAQKYDWKEFYAWKCVHRYKELAKEFKREYENGRR